MAYTTDPVDLTTYYRDIWRPDDGGANHPGIVVMHGGGFVTGTRTRVTDEAQTLANRVAIIARGQIVATGSPNTLGARGSQATIIRFSLPNGVVPPEALGIKPMQGGAWRVETEGPTRVLHELTGWAVAAGVELVGLEVSRPSLEDVYLALTSEEAEEGAA